jgi:acetoin utilization deacetylase AcuC-like enzyme
LSPRQSKVVFHENFHQVYTSDPAAGPGRMQAILDVIEPYCELIQPRPASKAAISAAHSQSHMDWVQGRGLYDIAALAAGGALTAAEMGLKEPTFGLIRPPGHHASRNSAWGYCYFNNMAVALMELKRKGKIERAFVLDIDLHYGDGTVNILDGRDWVEVYNVEERSREAYLAEVEEVMSRCQADLIAISAGFDMARHDWGDVLETADYREIGKLAAGAARRVGGGCFGVLEGGYNQEVLGHNVLALTQGMQEGWRA